MTNVLYTFNQSSLLILESGVWTHQQFYYKTPQVKGNVYLRLDNRTRLAWTMDISDGENVPYFFETILYYLGEQVPRSGRQSEKVGSFLGILAPLLMDIHLAPCTIMHHCLITLQYMLGCKLLAPPILVPSPRFQSMTSNRR